MEDCIFCKIADKSIESVILWEDSDLLVFLDRCPVREGHSQIITKQHFETFDKTPLALASKMVQVGQSLASKMKATYLVERIAFLFTGGDVPHVHAHVIPMHESTDITSTRYITSPSKLTFDSNHLLTDKSTLLSVQQKLGKF